MSQSQLLTNALKAAELVLTAETADTAELARIAEGVSGISADRILLGIDLTGIDLRNRDVSHLLDKQAMYHSAIMTVEQRRKFERSERQGTRRRMQMKIRSMRVDAIMQFIEDYEENGNEILAHTFKRPLKSKYLRDILIGSLYRRPKKEIELGASYAAEVVSELSPWSDIKNKDFYLKLFKLFDKLQARIDWDAAEILDHHYFPEFGQELGDVVAQMYPTPVLDSYWIMLDLRYAKLGEDLRPRKSLKKTFRSTVLLRALQISKVRPVHPAAVEDAMDIIKDISESIDFLEKIRFECDNDEAERIAVRITSSRWPPSETASVLNAHTNPRVRGALFRQLLQQGNEGRVIEVLRWLNADRGAVGALSLEDGFQHIRSFGVALRFAEEAFASFSDNQKVVVYSALRNIANSSNEVERLMKFIKSVNYEPPRSVPLMFNHRKDMKVEIERLARLLDVHNQDKSS